MAKINVESGGTILSSGLLQLSGGAAMSATLTAVTDQNNTASQLKLATNLTQVAGTLQIALDGGSYIDAQDVSGIDRFNVNRSAGSQQVNVDFSSNPTSGTDAVGALRTYANGVALSEAMTFLRNGNVGVGTTAPTEKVHILGADNTNLLNVSGASGKLRVKPYLNSTYGTLFESSTSAGALMPMSLSGSTLLLLDGNVGVNVTNPTARLQVKGSGSTSATTSLLVQNSGGSTALAVKDDLSTNLSGILNVIYSSSYISASGGANSATQFVANTSAGWNGFSFGNSAFSYFAEIRTDRTNVYTPLFVTSVGNSGNGAPPTPNASAQFQIDSTTKGFLPPRMTTLEKNAIATPAAGLMVYDTTLARPCFYNGAAWITL